MKLDRLSGLRLRYWVPAMLLAGITQMSGVHAQDTLQDTAQDDSQGNVPGYEIKYEGLPQVKDGRLSIPTLAAPSIATDEIGNGRTPEGFGAVESPTYPLPESAGERVEGWNWSICNWAAPNTFSNPRYFEDRMLERHGHQKFPKLQPAVSAARFVATVPMLPYLMTVRNPCDCEYTLGYYRPGSRTPGLVQRPPLERNAVIMESLVVAGVIIGFP